MITKLKIFSTLFHEARTNLQNRVFQAPDLPKDIFVVVIIILVACGAFVIGRHAGREEKRAGELRILDFAGAKEFLPSASVRASNAQSNVAHIAPITAEIPQSGSQGMYVGSKSGKTYHLPWCSGAQRIKEDNKVWFSSKTEAENKGYQPAANCKGI